MAPSGTPNRTGVRIHGRCRIDWIFINHHRRCHNDGPANDDRGRLLDNNRRRRPVHILLLIAWSLAIGSYRQVSGHCWRGKS
jgi:hypothetical protein